MGTLLIDLYQEKHQAIEPFNLTGSKAYKDLKIDKERKEFISHYTRQVKRQEQAINSLSPDELLSAIDAHKQSGRESPENQRAFTKKFKRNLQTTIEKSICGKPQYKNLSQAEIKKYAKDRTEEIASKLAALHDPDQELADRLALIKSWQLEILHQERSIMAFQLMVLQFLLQE